MSGTVTALNLARAQFAFTVSFHFIFPAFSIGLASYLAVLEALWLKTGNHVYQSLYRYWIKIFAMVFAMGVVSGIVMSYQFGTNWSVFSDKAGPHRRPPHGLRGALRLLPRGGLSRRDVVRPQQGGCEAAFSRHLHGGARNAAVGHLDTGREQLDADSRRLDDERRGPVRAEGILGCDHFQSEFSLSLRTHRHCGLPHDLAGGRRRRRVASAARPRQSRRAHHVLDGDVDGGHWWLRCRFSPATRRG